MLTIGQTLLGTGDPGHSPAPVALIYILAFIYSFKITSIERLLWARHLRCSESKTNELVSAFKMFNSGEGGGEQAIPTV